MKTVIITGAAGGIGLATTKFFLSRGYKVCATDVADKRLKSLNNQFQDEVTEHRLLLTTMNVENQGSVDHAVSFAQKEFGSIDILINNAGIFEICSFLELDEQKFLKLLNVNLLGAFRVALSVSKEMVKQKSGRIINVGSVAGLKGVPGASHYAASKAGLSALSGTMASELATHNIQVNMVIPGFIDTPMMDKMAKKMGALAVFRVPAKRLAKAEVVAEAI